MSVSRSIEDTTIDDVDDNRKRPKKLSLKRLKRTFMRKSPGRSVSVDERLASLTADHLTIIEDGDIRENGDHHLPSDDLYPDIPPPIAPRPAATRSATTLPEVLPAGDSLQSESAIRLRHRNRTWNYEDINKRLSLPADMHLPESFLRKQTLSPTLNGPINRRLRKTSLSEIGFGKLESYTKLDKLGEGTYATVYKGVSRLTDRVVALKEIRLEHEEGAPCTAIREVSLLRDLKHANIVTLHDIIHTDSCLTLVFEYLEKDLKLYMEECGNLLNINNVKLFLFQLLRGLAYCHKRRILHRDLKPQNLLINQQGELKLADFGLARAKSIPTKTYSNEVVTLWYRPPDVLLGSVEYSTPIDMWGVGCIFFEMASGRPLFAGSAVEEQLLLIVKMLGTPTELTWPGLTQLAEFQVYDFPRYRSEPLVKHCPRLDVDGICLLSSFLQYDAKKRISAEDSMKNRYFNSLGPEVHTLTDTESVFSIPGIVLHRDPGRRTVATTALTISGKPSRQSMVF